MNILFAFIAGWVWLVVLAIIDAKTGLSASSDAQFLSLAIVVGGALASPIGKGD